MNRRNLIKTGILAGIGSVFAVGNYLESDFVYELNCDFPNKHGHSMTIASNKFNKASCNNFIEFTQYYNKSEYPLTDGEFYVIKIKRGLTTEEYLDTFLHEYKKRKILNYSQFLDLFI